MEDRPRIKLTLSGFDKNLDMLGYVLFFIMWALTIYVFVKLPPIIPTHFGMSGKPDDYGRKETLLLIPIIGTIIFFGITQLSKYPHIFNYTVRITEENAARQYGSAVKIFRFLKVSIMIILTTIILITYLTVIGKSDGPGSWFLPMTFALLLIPTIVMVVKSFKDN
ncbi:MAG: DUF1648 domain-containing protein [Ferruginibacter sp.]